MLHGETKLNALSNFVCFRQRQKAGERTLGIVSVLCLTGLLKHVTWGLENRNIGLGRWFGNPLTHQTFRGGEVSGGHLSAECLLVSTLSAGGACFSSPGRVMASERQTREQRVQGGGKDERGQERDQLKRCGQIRKWSTYSTLTFWRVWWERWASAGGKDHLYHCSLSPSLTFTSENIHLARWSRAKGL